MSNLITATGMPVRYVHPLDLAEIVETRGKLLKLTTGKALEMSACPTGIIVEGIAYVQSFDCPRTDGDHFIF